MTDAIKQFSHGIQTTVANLYMIHFQGRLADRYALKGKTETNDIAWQLCSQFNFHF